MPCWIALSDHDAPPPTPHGAGSLLDRGRLVIELAVPLKGPGVLLDYRCDKGGWPRVFSLFLDGARGIGVLHRQGQALARHNLAGPLPQEPGLARLTFAWDAPARWWELRYECSGRPEALAVRGVGPLPVPLDDLMALCRGGAGTARHPAVLWFGVTSGVAPPDRAPWLGLRTPVATPTGPRPAGALRQGDMVMTDSGARMLRSVRRMNLPSRGFFAPVLLRAPYFRNRFDLLVSADQRLLLSGPEVEYLFAEDEVLVEARHLADGVSALFDSRRGVTTCVSLDLGEIGLIRSDGCTFASTRHDAAGAAETLPRRLLRGYEAVPLLALLGRGNGRRAA